MHVPRRTAVALFAIVAAAPALLAQDRTPGAANENAKKPAPGVLRLLPSDAVSDKQVTAGGRTVAYTATAGTLPLYDQNGEQSAAVFYTAYAAKEADAAKRPVTFAFNGGPGAASTFLNFGLAGPRILDFGPNAPDGAAAKLVDNPETWLEFTDLVMIDPIGTGWSRAAKSDGGSAFWGVQRDAQSIAKVIALYVAHNGRSASPKYLLGESYGGFRAVKVARALQGEQGIVVSGIVMVSPMLEASLQWSGARDALGAALHFPSLVATELERTRRFTPQALADAERFALNEYLPGLAGPRLSGEAAARFYRRIAEFTGLAPDEVAKSRGYVRSAYLQHLRENGQTASLYDASFTYADPYPDGEGRHGPDPMLDGFVRALAGTFAGYARNELGFRTDMTYTLLARDVGGKWDWGDRRNPPGVSDDLRTLLSLNPSFRLLVSHGTSDLVTPYGVSRYVLDRIPEIGGAERLSLKTYRGGHMFYFAAEQRRAFTAEAKAFYRTGP
ncbi:MAG: carboxypeptidase [Alphaproteobacteria bacterium]|nr:carboxypeptidase [Alphaproteobacteria bacterium]